MNLILFAPGELVRGRLVLADRRARHVCGVLRAAPGERLRVGMIRGGTGIGEVRAVDRDRVELAVTLNEPASAPPGVDLVLAVPRPKILPRVIEAAASLGVERIDLVNAWRVDRSYLDSRRIDLSVLAHHARLGCEQGGSTWVPELAVHRLLMPFVREVLPGRLAAAGRALIAHPRAAVPIEAAVPPGSRERVLLAVGPEGGWIEREVDTFTARGFDAVTCMERVLRVETAVPALLAQLGLLRRLG